MDMPSPVQMIFDSGLYALVILAILFLMSFFAWGVILMKWKENKKKKNNIKKFLRIYEKVNHFREIPSIYPQLPACALKDIADSVLTEVKRLSPYVSYDSLHHRSALLEESVERAIDRVRLEEDKYLAYLALCSTLSPFLGLLGTVWGIMASFFEIGAQGSAELSVVAPGIAAALVTTVGGLLAAIPASAAYNMFISANNRAETDFSNFGSELLSLFKRADLQVLEADMKS